MMMFIVATAVALGCLQQFKCNAQLPAVGKCPFMEYYCTLREYESYFFRTLYYDSQADCRLQFWIMYYRFLSKGNSCLNNSKKLAVKTGIKEMQSLYCSGLDLQRPLLTSLSPCSDTHRNKIDQCLNEFAATFTWRNGTQESLCRKRGKAKMCVVLAWQASCNQSDVADAIFNKVLGTFNPYCKNEKDPWAVKTDLCTSYRIPYRNPECGSCPAKPKSCQPRRKRKFATGKNSERTVLDHSLNPLLYMTAVLYLNYLMFGM